MTETLAVPPADPPPQLHLAKTLLKGLRVMEAFDAGHRELGLSEIVAMTGIEISGARRLLATLVAAGYLEQDGRSRRYRLSAKVLAWSVAYLGNDPLVACAHPVLQSVAQETGHQFELCVLSETDTVVLLSVTGAAQRLSLVKGPSVGVREPAFCSPTGLAILSHLPQRRAFELIGDEPRRGLTEHTVTDTDAILEALAFTRTHGYAVTDRACHPRAICVGAPVFDYARQPIAAVAVTVDVGEFTPERAEAELAEPVLRTAKAISLAYQRST